MGDDCKTCEKSWHELDVEQGTPNGDGELFLNDDGDYVQRASVDNSAWDGNAAMSKCSSSEKPGSCFSAICAGRREGPADERGSWALPHHKSPGSPPNAAGVRNALARLGQTQGLSNKEAARSHLEKHMSSISPDSGDSKSEEAVNEARMARLRAAGEKRKAALMADHMGWSAGERCQRAAPAGNARTDLAFPAQFKIRAELVEKDGMEYRQIDGWASVVEIDYEMYDMFGPYDEVIDRAAFNQTLNANPDVALLLNHRGTTMARTTNNTLSLSMDEKGLHPVALVNPKRTDVKDMVIAIDDGDLNEMSFAFLLVEGEWNDDFTRFRIKEVNIDRGDVSVVNYGANPYTSVTARQQEIIRDARKLFEELPSARNELPVGLKLVPTHELEQSLLSKVFEGMDTVQQARAAAKAADEKATEVFDGFYDDATKPASDDKPIPEGNGRSVKLLMAQLAVGADYDRVGNE